MCIRDRYLFTLASSKHESVTRPVSKAFSGSNITADEFRNGSEALFERRIRRKLRKATKVVEQPNVEQRDLENLRRISKRRKKVQNGSPVENLL